MAKKYPKSKVLPKGIHMSAISVDAMGDVSGPSTFFIRTQEPGSTAKAMGTKPKAKRKY